MDPKPNNNSKYQFTFLLKNAWAFFDHLSFKLFPLAKKVPQNKWECAFFRYKESTIWMTLLNWNALSTIYELSEQSYLI